MTTIKQPTPEEIHQAAINAGLRYGVGRYAIVEITFKYAISWLQNYQTQQQGAVKSAEEILANSFMSFDNPNYRQSIIECIHEFHNQFQTPALGTTDTRSKEQTPTSGGSEWISVKDRYPQNRSNVIVYTKNGNCQLIVEYKHACFFDGLTQIHNVTHWKYLDSDPDQSF